MADELPPEVYEKVVEHSARGDALAEEQRYDAALEEYREAWRLLPGMMESWDAATWLLAAIGDVEFLKGEFASVVKTLTRAMMCPGGIGNSFLHLRLGQAQFELGAEAAAADELTRAYMGAGEQIFESDDAKYLAFLKTRIRPPRLS